ncbi:ribonuclease J [Mycoplasma sp. ATU-Cv-508]|uniref:ribonuclease J n=1 Tax=Mycoplasma sp. ATU-Cv-508 TaxID=2048001 RepID=UPI000FDF53F2
MADINIFALGGQDENGKNCYVLEVNRDIYVINAGIKVPINNRYGIDGIIPSFDYLVKRRKSIKGIFITHAHDDVFAALPWLIMDLKGVKIYASNFTSKVIKDRISKYKINHQDYEIKVINKRMNFGSVEVEPFEVANSIVGSYCYKFLTPDGDIVFMSNFIIDDLGQFGKTSLNRIAQPNRKILALMLDARRSNFHGRSSEHKSVVPIIEPQFSSASPTERIIVGAYDEEMYVLQEVLELCVKYNRPVVLYGRTYQTLYNFLKMENPSLSEPRILDYRTISKHDNAVVLITGTWSRLYQRFVRIAERADVYLKLKSTDRIVMIAPPINGLEVEYTQMLDKVTMTTANITEVTYSDYYSLRPADLDIRETVQVLKPQYFIPISALYRYLVVAKKLSRSRMRDAWPFNCSPKRQSGLNSKRPTCVAKRSD